MADPAPMAAHSGADSSPRQQDGGGYGRPRSTFNRVLSEVGPDTPCGELMRRYWQPVGLSATTTMQPKEVRILGEDLILFRDGAGRAGLVHARCCHRGTSLCYGKVEESGIRCCYHGWLFDVEGRCLEQPCEPDGGLHRDKVRQPWYPVEERYGLVFAYMGPLDRKPALPRYDVLENLKPGESLEQEDKSFYVGGGGFTSENPHVPYNWLQNYENVMDPYHVLILHSRFTGVQFKEEFAITPKVSWDYHDHGIATHSLRVLADGRQYVRVTQVLLPNIRIVPTIELTSGPGNELAWIVPVDDTMHRTFGVAKVTQSGTYTRRSRLADHDGKIWTEMSDDEHRRFPDDFEAQKGQGPINLHSEEHLATSDKGVAMLRRLLTREITRVQEGQA
ncbi:MAG: aromatic ring-hydroxylating dioxygenase subunit alpha, partial [Caldimonas sp.]